LTITLPPPPLWKRSKARLLKACLAAGVILVIGASPPIALMLTTEDGPSVTVVFALVAVAVGAAIVANEINFDRVPATLQLSNGTLTLTRGSAKGTAWTEFASAEAADGELRITRNNGEVFRILKERTDDERRRVADLLNGR
jgi:hypothetical protein